ncbi:MAG: LysR family transcriptional regulator [Dehalococcoidia bacterium]
MDMVELRAFCAVAEEGSFTSAARRLGMSQPGLSRQVQRLERELGASLLERGGPAIRLTAAGERVLKFASKTINEYDALIRHAANGAAALSGVVRIVASTTPGEYLAPSLAARFTETNPEVRTQIFVTDSSVVPCELLERRWDVGFVGCRADQPGLVHVPMARDEVVLAAPASHPFARSGTVTAEQLADEKLIQREDGSGTHRTVVEALAERGLSLPSRQPVMSLSSTQAIVSAVDAGLGVGFVSTRALERHQPARVAAVRLEGAPIIRDLYLVYESARPRPPHVQAFIDFIPPFQPQAAEAGDEPAIRQ